MNLGTWIKCLYNDELFENLLSFLNLKDFCKCSRILKPLVIQAEPILILRPVFSTDKLAHGYNWKLWAFPESFQEMSFRLFLQDFRKQPDGKCMCPHVKN